MRPAWIVEVYAGDAAACLIGDQSEAFRRRDRHAPRCFEVGVLDIIHKVRRATFSASFHLLQFTVAEQKIAVSQLAKHADKMPAEAVLPGSRTAAHREQIQSDDFEAQVSFWQNLFSTEPLRKWVIAGKVFARGFRLIS